MRDDLCAPDSSKYTSIVIGIFHMYYIIVKKVEAAKRAKLVLEGPDVD